MFLIWHWLENGIQHFRFVYTFQSEQVFFIDPEESLIEHLANADDSEVSAVLGRELTWRRHLLEELRHFYFVIPYNQRVSVVERQRQVVSSPDKFQGKDLWQRSVVFNL